MSELSRLVQKTQKNTEEVQLVQQCMNNATLNLESCAAMCAKLESITKEIQVDLAPNSEKFISKMNAVDPVSGARRFGKETENKILGLQSAVSLLDEQCKACLEESKNNLSVLLAEKQAADVLLNATSVQDENENTAADKEKADLARAKEDADRLAELELNRKAAQVREKKAAEAASQSQFDEEIKSALDRVAECLKTSSPRTDDTAVNAVLDEMHHYYTSDPDLSKTGCDMLAMVVGILERIINRPDDAACRRLRVTHPTLLAKLTGLRYGIELLSALGCTLQVTPLPDRVTSHSSNGRQQNVYDLSKCEDQRFTSNYSGEIRRVIAEITSHSTTSEPVLQHMTDLMVLLTPHTVWDGVLEMHEPALVLGGAGIGGKSDWIDWFDALTRRRDLLKERARLW